MMPTQYSDQLCKVPGLRRGEADFEAAAGTGISGR